MLTTRRRLGKEITSKQRRCGAGVAFGVVRIMQRISAHLTCVIIVYGFPFRCVYCVLLYLELEQPGGVLEDDGLDVAANLDGVDGDAGDEVEEDVVAVRPVGQWVRERHLALTFITLYIHANHDYGRSVCKSKWLAIIVESEEPRARQEPPAEVFLPHSSCTQRRQPQ